MLSHFLRELLLPPTLLILAMVLGLLGWRRYPRAAQGVLWASVLAFYLLSIPLVSVGLHRATESLPPITLTQIAEFAPDAVVVLGGGARRNAPEYGGKTVPTESTWSRVAYAAYLAQHTELPVLACGGMGEAEAMAEVLRAWNIPEVEVEDRSQTTWENAVFGYQKLQAQGRTKILLVTHAQHAWRAEYAFRLQGLEVLSAPTDYRAWEPRERGLMLLVPTHRHFDESCTAMRTVLGEIWYRLRSVSS